METGTFKEFKKEVGSNPKVSRKFGIVVISIVVLVFMAGFMLSYLVRDNVESVSVNAVPSEVVSIPFEKDLSNPEIGSVDFDYLSKVNEGNISWFRVEKHKVSAKVPEGTPSGDYSVFVKSGDETHLVTVNVDNPKQKKLFSVYAMDPKLSDKGLVLDIVNGGTGKENVSFDITLTSVETGKSVISEGNKVGTLYDHTTSTVTLKKFRKLAPGGYVAKLVLHASADVKLEFSIEKHGK